MGKSKPVSADNHPVLQDHAIPDAAILAYYSMGMGEEVVADLRAAIDSDEAVQHGMTANFDVFVNYNSRARDAPRRQSWRFSR